MANLLRTGEWKQRAETTDDIRAMPSGTGTEYGIRLCRLSALKACGYNEAVEKLMARWNPCHGLFCRRGQ